jgi:hypothetical protein
MFNFDNMRTNNRNSTGLEYFTNYFTACCWHPVYESKSDENAMESHPLHPNHPNRTGVLFAVTYLEPM